MRWSSFLAVGTLAFLGRSPVDAEVKADSFQWPWESPQDDKGSLQPAALSNGTVDLKLHGSDGLGNMLMKGSEFTRLVYNRVPKTGSTTMKELFDRLAKRNNFEVHNDEEFLPDIRRLRGKIRALPKRTIYVNHCQFWPDAPSDVGWINMVREPIDLAASSYYYSVDAEARHSEKAALEALAERKAFGSCGCYKLEFDACVRERAKHNCTEFAGRDGLMVHETDFFCEHRHGEAHCRLGATKEASKEMRLEAQTQLGVAMANARDKYFFVGLTEEFVRSVNVLEALLPDWFAGASEELGKMARMKELTLHNPLTGTTQTGCVSDEAKDDLKALEPACSQELEFYDGVKLLFWQRFASVGHLIKDKQQVKPHEFRLPYPMD